MRSEFPDEVQRIATDLWELETVSRIFSNLLKKRFATSEPQIAAEN